MLTSYKRTGSGIFTFFLLHVAAILSAQCPNLSQSATLTSSDCAPGLSPCTLCPGDVFTLTGTGTNIVPAPGNCINWYYGTTNTFNPYNGEGTLLGCSPITSAPINCGAPCPTFLGIFIDACGTEENNEFLGLYSGGGFNVDDLTIDFDDNNNVGSGNDDIGTGCSFQGPDPALLATIQNNCPNSTVIGVGSGQTVPPNVPVVVFTSAGMDFDYNFSGLCSVFGNIYVLQSSCTRTTGAFTNGGPNGSVSTTVSVCGCSSNITYNTSQVSGGNGAAVALTPLGPIYLNAGCSFPSFPTLPGSGAPPIIATPLDVTVTPDMCNGGPYYVVGIYEPLPAGCTQTFTNYMGFNVPCPNPMLGTSTVCENISNFNLVSIQDPTVPTGVWSGPGVTGNTFNANGLSGDVTLNFTPSGPCTTPANTTITVNPSASAVFEPITPVCVGSTANLVINFTGQAPWTFNLYQNGTLLNNITTFDNPASIAVVPTGNSTNYSIGQLQDAFCNGAGSSIVVTTTAAPSGTFSLNGPSNICAGQSANFTINVTNGTAPFSFQYAVNGVNSPVLSSNTNPIIFSAPIISNCTVNIANFSANGCPGGISGSAVMTVAPALSASVVGGKKTLCNGQIDTVRFNFSGNGPFTYVYALNNVAQPAVTTSNNAVKIPVTPPTGTHIYKLLSVSANGCTGTISGADTLVVLPPAEALLSGNTTICPGASTDLTVQFSGTPPYVFAYEANSVLQGPVTTNVNPYILQVAPTISTAFALNSMSAGGCNGIVGGQAAVVINDTLTAVLSGGGEICQGGNGTDLVINFTGSGPYTFIYGIVNNGVPIPQPAITTSNNPYIFNVNPANGTFYVLLSVSSPGCIGTASGQAGVFVFTPPTADLTGTATFCDSAVTNLTIDFTGTGPFGITYTKDGVPQMALNTFDDPFLIPVNISSTSTYVLTSVTSPGCTGLPTGNATLTVNYAPNYANVIFNCNPTTLEYVIEFDVLNAVFPLTLVTGSGTFSGTHFTSTPISQANGYNIIFRDANNCGDIVVSGTVNCNCQTNAGTMDLMPLLLCAGDTAKAKHNNDFFNDGNDLLRFILHTTPGLPLGTILAWSSTPTFTQTAGVLPGVTYYISPIAGNPDGNGQIDLNDLCLSISEGTPVVFYPLPSASLSSDIDICAGVQVNVPVILNGTAPFTLNWTNNGLAQSANNINSGFYPISFPAVNSTSVQLVQITDAHCSASVPDTVLVHVGTVPQIQNFMYLCNLVTGTYTLTFDCVGVNPLTVGGVGGTFTGNKFTSVPVPIGLPYSISLTDVDGCGQDTETGTPVCACATNAGIMNQTPISLCYGQSIATVLPVTGSVLEADDTLYYALINPGFDIIASNTTPVFQFNPATMFPDSVYLVVALAGNVINGQIDFADPCLSVASGPYVSWQPPILASLSGDTTLCIGDSTQIRVDFMGKGPYSLAYLTNGSLTSLTGVTFNPLLINIGPTVATTYTLANVSGALGCLGTVGGTAQVALDQLPEILDIQAVCDFSTATYTLQFKINNGVTPNPLYAVTGVAGTLTDTSFVSLPIPKNQPYQVTVTNGNGCSTTITGVSDCVCPTFAGTLDQAPVTPCFPDSTFSVAFNNNEVLPPNNLLQFVLCQDTALLPMGVLQTSSTPDFSFQPGMQTGVSYFVVAVAGTSNSGSVDWADPCLSISGKTSVIFYPQPTAKINGDTAICRGEGLSFKIRFTGQGPFRFVYAINGVPQASIVAPNTSFNISTNNVQQAQVFSLISVEDAHCTGVVTGTYQVALLPETSAALAGDTTICVGDSALLRLSLVGADTFDVVVTDGTTTIPLNAVSDGSTFLVNPGFNNQYWIQSYSAQGNTCVGSIRDTVNILVQKTTATAQISNYNNFNISCFDGRNGQIELLPLTGQSPFNAIWNNGSNGLIINNLQAGSYAVTLTDQTGCIYIDSFSLIQPEPIGFDYRIQQTDCAGNDRGIVTLTTAEGGAGPYLLYVNASTSQQVTGLPLELQPLDPGVFTLTLADANGCTVAASDTIDAPTSLLVDLGPDQVISFGDSVLLVAMVDGGSLLETISWNPLTNLTTPGQLSTYVSPERTTTYEIMVVDTAGCKGNDQIRITVDRSKRVYLPNALDPGADAPNNYFTVYGGAQVTKVEYLRIYDRWGSLLFENKDFLPNLPEAGWDGKDRGQWVSPGVYVYEVMVAFRDGKTEVYLGDVSVLR
ncbi:MAG: gliding motility-associated C-terminal domain-containing protein [Saprospiraceae bacterium]|nr:gliding motility-associated C-terminal domain-containing protein [Saprospiraceae bacterium]